ncbi:glutaminase [Mycobacterium frederiksbergense]|uniref:Glutaminase n=1 Tax=Mycolicibacterium frederiksbergense TaxID=117567 RepID=A0ABT6KYX4_9MYCO|nr:glutaminase A [Mycolicibacterium frederiksbergense]MDH6195212.1 glutaminase [Mycolicibacterium frederiksbergense]
MPATCSSQTSGKQLREYLDAAHIQGLRAARTGVVSRQVPALAEVSATRFAMAVATVDGAEAHIGESDAGFSIQSLSKLFALCALLRHEPEAWPAVGWGPSDAGYGSVADLEHNDWRPRNPFVNSGALVVTDRLLMHSGDAVSATVEMLGGGAGEVFSDPRVAQSEIDTDHRNSAIAHVLAEHGRLVNPIDVLLPQYFAQCAITASVRTLARAALFLADRDSEPSGGQAVLDPATVRRVNAVLLMSGMYGAAGDIAYRIGLPAKSGIGGGVLAVMPGRGAVCVWSPPLDGDGNSAGGVAAIEEFARCAGWSVF